MSELTRRGFLTHSSIAAGVALAGGVALRQLYPGSTPPKLAASATAVAASPASAPVVAQPALAQQGLAFTTAPLAGAAMQQPMVVHVRNSATGEISLMVGTQELVYRDPDLVARLVQTATSANMAEG